MEAKNFKVGMRVRWATNPADKGTVIEVGYCRVKVRWDPEPDGEQSVGIYGETGFPLVVLKR